jgi:hypothetical protein
MPDQEHLILVLAREAEVITHDMPVFFAPARDFIEPGAGWPPDLTPGELAGLIPQLRRTIGWLSDVITQVAAGNQADPDKARLVTEGARLTEQGGEAIRAGETLFGAAASPPGSRPQQEVAAQDYPHGAAAGPASGASAATPAAGPAIPAAPGPGDNPGPAPGMHANRARRNR